MTDKPKKLDPKQEKFARPVCLFLADKMEQEKMSVAEASNFANEIVKRVTSKEDYNKINEYLIDKLPGFKQYLENYQGEKSS